MWWQNFPKMCRSATNLETSCKVSHRLPGPLLAFAEPMFAKLLGKKLNISAFVAWRTKKSKGRTTEMNVLMCCLAFEV
jgi:hypothetical protein